MSNTRTVIKTFTIKIVRQTEDELGFSRDALEQLQVSMIDSFKKAFMEALEKDRILPQRCVVTVKYAIEGTNFPG